MRKRIYYIVVLLLLCNFTVVIAGSPYNSASSNYIRKNWTSSTTWASGNIPPTSSFTTNDQININYGSPYQSIKYAGTLNLQAGSNVSLTIASGDTLICDGLTITSGCNVTVNGVLIVNGNFTNSGGITVGNTIIVKGNLDNTSGNINNGTTYTFGTVVNVGSGSSTRKTQTDFNIDFASGTNVYKSTSNASSWYTATYTWDGGGSDNNWMTAANWVGDVAPTGDENLVFTGSTRTSPVNDFTAGTSFNSISFSSGASNFTLSGNAFILSGGTTAIVASNTTNTMTINNNITFSTSAPTVTTSSGGILNIAGTITNGGYLITVACGGTATFSGVISGTGGITKSGSGTLTLEGANTYSGTTSISAGTLQIGNGSTTGILPGNITNNSILTFNRSDAYGYSGIISGTGAVNHNGAGTLTLLGANTYSGLTTVAASRTLQIGNNTALGDVAGNVELLSGNPSTLLLISSGVTVTGKTLIMNSNSTGDLRSNIAVTSGTATWNGTITLTGTGQCGFWATNGYVLNINGTVNGSCNILNLTGAAVGSPGQGYLNAPLLIGATSVVKDLAGTWTITSTSTRTGTTKIQSTGTLIVNTTTSLGTGDVNLYGGNLSVLINGSGNNGTISLGNNFVINSTMSGTIHVGNNGSNTGNTISFGTCNIGAASTFNITGANGYNVQYTTMDLLGGSAGTSIINPTTANILIGSITTNNSLHTIQLDGTSTGNNISGIISDNITVLTVSKANTGTWTLSGANTYTGTTNITGGRLKLGATGVIPDASAVTVTSPGILDMNTFSETVGSIAGTGTIDNVAGGGTPTLTCGGNNSNTTFSGIIQNTSGVLAFTKVGLGELTITNNNLFSGVTSVNAGTLVFSSFGTLYNFGTTAGSIVVNNGGTIRFDRSDFMGTHMVVPVPTVTVNAGGTLYANGTYTTLNNLILSGGSLISNGGAWPTWGTFALKGTVTVNGTSTSTMSNSGGSPNFIHIGDNTNGGTTTFNVAANCNPALVISSQIVNAYQADPNLEALSGIIKTGAGTMVLSGPNSYTGLTSINGGTIKLGASGVIPDVSAVTVNGILDMNTYSETVGSITGGGTIDNVAGGGTPTLTNGGNNSNTTFSGIIQNTSGTLTIAKTGNGTLTLSGANTYTGLTTVNGGILQLNNTSALGTNAAGTVVNNGCSLDLNGLTYVTTEPLTLNGTGYSGGGALMNSNVANASFAGTISLSGATTINTTNQITLSGTITPYTENLTKAGANSLVLTSNAVTVNDLAISAGTISAGSSTINIYGNFTNSGTFASNTSTVSLLGSISQVIPSISYNNLIINNSNGTTLVGDATVLGTLTLTTGNIDVDGHTLTVSAISGGSSSSYILTKSAYNAGSSSGYLKILGVGNNVQTLFPVGVSSNSYTPCYIQNKGTSQDFKVRVFSGVYDYGMSGSIKSDSARLVNKTWEITPIIETDIQAKIKVQWNASDEGSIFKTKRSAAYFSKNRHITGDNAWIAQASDAVIGSGPYSIVTSGWITTFSNGGVGCDDALPIELKTFTVKKHGNNVSIDWSTMSETNNDHFTLERSIDGETWDVINTCSGAGNSTQEHLYSFIDNNPSIGINYYRLKQTDVDGAFTYSKIESVKFTNDSISMQIYPTPAIADEIKIVIKSFRSCIALIEIYDTYCRQLYKGEIELSPDPLYLKLTNFCTVNPGIYYLTIKYGDMVLRKVFVVE